MRWRVDVAGVSLLVVLGAGGCAGSTPGSSTNLSPTMTAPASRCRTSAASDSPLVTEWSASEKAHLEGLSANQAVAVVFSGCELRVVDGCRPSGKYGWRRTTLSTDTIEIGSGDDLWTKLPLGAVRLEGELARSGRLAIRTTVAGQMSLTGFDPESVVRQDACSEVTHVVTAISVGAFGLLSGGAMSARGGGGVVGIGAGAGTRREEEIVRRAGDPGSCSSTREDSPHAQCAAPIQIFLQPVAGRVRGAMASAEPASRVPSIVVTFPAPENTKEHWSLRDASGGVACELPCTRPIAPGSGYYLERSPGNGFDLARVEIPARLPHPPESHVTASYRAERGHPFLSSLTFYGVGVPAAIGGTIVLGLAAAGTGKDDRADGTGHDRTGFLVGAGVFYLAIAGASLGWWMYSHPAGFETSGARTGVRVTPTGFSGSF